MARAHPGRALALAAVLALAGGVLVGCSSGGPATPDAADPAGDSATHAVSTGADCLAPQVLTALGFDGDQSPRAAVHPDAPDAGAVPDGFTAMSAVLCTTGETLTDASGRWAAVTARRLEGDVAPLVRALTSGATAPATSATSTCAPGAVRTDLWLVDALGAALRVALPGDGCGQLPVAVTDGLDTLVAVDVEHYPITLVEPRATVSPSEG